MIEKVAARDGSTAVLHRRDMLAAYNTNARRRPDRATQSPGASVRSLLFIWLLGFTHSLPAEPPKELTDLERLQGEWVLVGLEVREQSVPADKLAGTTLVVRKDKYATVVKT